jgi:hypothetical protein
VDELKRFLAERCFAVTFAKGGLNNPEEKACIDQDPLLQLQTRYERT